MGNGTNLHREDAVVEVIDYNTSVMPPPQLPFFLELVELPDVLWADFLLSWQYSILVFKWGFFAKGLPLESGTGYLNIKPETGFRTGFVISHRGWRLTQARRRLLMSLSHRPVNVIMNASLTRRNSILKTVKKEELWSPDFMTLPGSSMKKMC